MLAPNCQSFDCLKADLVVVCLEPQEVVRSLLLLLEYVEGSAEPARAEIIVGAMQTPLLAAKKVRERKPAGLCQVLYCTKGCSFLLSKSHKFINLKKQLSEFLINSTL